MRKLLLLLVAICGALPLFVIAPVVADADGQVRLGIAPLGHENNAYFSLTLAPGESRVLKVEVGNYGSDLTKVRTYAADAYTIANGGFGARLDGEPTSGTTTWLDYPSRSLDLGAGEAIQQEFVVGVPADAPPGEYITSLVVQNAIPTAAGSGAVAFQQVQRKAIAVAVTVPGERQPNLHIGSFSHQLVAGRSVITATVGNTGNVHLKPAGEFVVHDEQGIEVARYAVQMDSFYAGTETIVELPFDRPLNAENYQVTLTLGHEGGSARSEPTNVTVLKEAIPVTIAPDGSRIASPNQQSPAPDGFPLMLVLGAGLVALVAALLVTGATRARRQQARPAGEAVLAPHASDEEVNARSLESRMRGPRSGRRDN